MINVSSGSAGVLGLSKIKQKAPPTTAYLMLGAVCTNNCKFCSQSKESLTNSNKLSRVDWVEYDENRVLEKIGTAFMDNKIKRMCLQVVNGKNSLDMTFSILEKIKKEHKLSVPVCSSINIKSVEEASKFFEAGMDRLCVALDAASDIIYERVKGKGYLNKLNLLKDLAKKFPDKITTHLIVGLGETEMEMAKMIEFLSNNSITIALFAFTPIDGTMMGENRPPEITTYRKAQIINYLMKNKHITTMTIFNENEIIKGFGEQQKKDNIFANKLKEILLHADGVPFMTSGCPDCNRPYYNEKSRGIPYNYPIRPTEDEVVDAINISGLFE